MKVQRIINKTVWIVSLVSLFTDVSSEMLYPIMPIYLKSIGFSVGLIGLLEGLAEATAGLSKGYFGKLSDRMQVRMPFVRLGYGLSALSKPMMALFVSPSWIFFARTADRLGKGLRTGARDALLSEQTTPEHKGKVFGFHRSMDTVGAAIGPAIALLYLYFHPGEYRQMFLYAFLPALLGVALTFIIKEKRKGYLPSVKGSGFFSFFNYWSQATTEYRRLVLGLLLFTLINSSDAFLLLMMKYQGLADFQLVLVYIFYNIVYATAAYPMGILADNIGLKKTYIIGLLFFAVTYLMVPYIHTLILFGGAFIAYALYAASTEGIAKAWVSNISRRENTATAIGFYTGLSSILTLIASTMAGVLWQSYGPTTAFLVSGTGAILLVFYFLLMVRMSAGTGAVSV